MDIPYTCMVDLLENNHISWKTYQEDYPGNCFSGMTSGGYRRIHNPFISFDLVRNNATRCAKIVSAQQLDTDLSAGNLPAFSFYTPAVASSVNVADFVSQFLNTKARQFPEKTLTVVTWDLGDNPTNLIPAFVLGPMIPPGTQDSRLYDHYTILRTVEKNWYLGTLAHHDADDVDDGFDVLYPLPPPPVPEPPPPVPQPPPPPHPQTFYNGTGEQSHMFEYVAGGAIVVVLVGSILLLAGTTKGRAAVLAVFGGRKQELLAKTDPEGTGDVKEGSGEENVEFSDDSELSSSSSQDL